jgi:hypothetical protein
MKVLEIHNQRIINLQCALQYSSKIFFKSYLIEAKIYQEYRRQYLKLLRKADVIFIFDNKN